MSDTERPEPTVTLSDAEDGVREYVELLRRLVLIESPTRDEGANLEMADALETSLTELGGRVERCPAFGLGVHLVANFGVPDVGPAPGPRQARARRDDRPLLIVGHMDTVHARGTLDRLPFRVVDDRITGPGVYDMKGGVTAALVGLRLLLGKGGSPSWPLRFLITCDEEIGSPTSRDLIEAEAREARAALILEPSVPGGGVKRRRKGVGGYVLTAAGKAAHAGIEPEAGASAVHELARQVAHLLELEDREAGTTVNVGVFKGGTKENVVAESARCTVDVRFWTRAEADRMDGALRRLEPLVPGCSLTLEGGVNRYALERTPEGDRLFEAARTAADELGFSLGEGETGGGSDGNLTAAVGCPTLDGLGPDGGGAHALTEHILLADIPRRIALMAALFEGVA